MNTHQYLQGKREQAEADLIEFLRIPSISTDPAHEADVAACAHWLEAKLRSIGMPTVEIHATHGHPIVYAEDLRAGATAPTVLFYGHYDVQPVDPLNLWTNPPFEPVVRDGKVYARGATDDKGQVLLHIYALEALYAAGTTLPVNVKLIIEGEEEIGSPNLSPYLEENAHKLQCNAVVVSDTPMFAPGVPSIVYGLRGLAYVQIDVTGPNRDLHSGSYGGAVGNPLNALAHIIAKLKSEDGTITIPGFYDNVVELDSKERESLADLGYSNERLMLDVGMSALMGEPGYSTPERLWARPTLDVNGILGGFTGEGAKTVLPSVAMAKVSMRLVPNQDHHEVVQKISDYIHQITPEGFTVSVTDLHGANPVIVSRDTPAVRAAVKALEEAFEAPCRFTREGGSIPVVLLFDTILRAPTVLMGFGLNNENAHSPDEHFDLNNFHTGMRAAARFYELMSEQK